MSKQRPAPSRRPNHRLSNPERNGSDGWGLAVSIWAVVMLAYGAGILVHSIWVRTCGLGASC